MSLMSLRTALDTKFGASISVDYRTGKKAGYFGSL